MKKNRTYKILTLVVCILFVPLLFLLFSAKMADNYYDRANEKLRLAEICKDKSYYFLCKSAEYESTQKKNGLSTTYSEDSTTYYLSMGRHCESEMNTLMNEEKELSASAEKWYGILSFLTFGILQKNEKSGVLYSPINLMKSNSAFLIFKKGCYYFYHEINLLSEIYHAQPLNIL